jgi:beta-glucosidase
MGSTRLSLLFLLAGAIAAAQTTSGWQLVWSDDFNGAAGTAPSSANWNYDIGNNGGWGNGEIESYTTSTNNVFQDGNGNLVIRVTYDPQNGYLSGRLQTGAPGASTHGADGNWQYGRIEARIKLPFGKGVWPAFWMLGENFNDVGWPKCGEVDIMENFGTFNNNATLNNGTIHGYDSNSPPPHDYPPSGIGTSVQLPFGETVYDDYHLYAIEWSPNTINFFVDGNMYQSLTPSNLNATSQWEFNASFFILLNVAIGGPSTFLGTPDSSVTFPQSMLVDYVRVYQPLAITDTTPVITPGRVVSAASLMGDLAPGSIATLYGNNLADAEHIVPMAQPGQTFPTNVAGVSVTVNGVAAPLTYVSPAEIEFQIPWETPSGANGLLVPVQASRSVNGGPAQLSNVENVTIASTTAPSFFLTEYITNGVAWVTGNPADGCPTPTTECAVQAGSTYQLWGTGLGPKTSALQDGTPAPDSELQVPGGPGACQLTIDGQPATVVYCGAAPEEIIDQVNFIYPAGVSTGSPFVTAVFTYNGASIHFRVPAPSQPSPDERADALLAQMTQAQKLALVNGDGGPVTNIPALPRGAGGYIQSPGLGIPNLYFVDGSLGLADSQAPATALPSALASAATFDTRLAYQFGSVIGAEVAAYGLNVNLGGNINLIGREPRDGRTFETKGEDPILAGKITAAHVEGVQDQHVIGCVKHYALNDQETGRTLANAEIDERGMRESDLLAFEIAVKDSNVQSVMCSYNQVNGAYACENSHLLTDILKTGWGFPGFVMSDWWALPASGPSSTTVTAALAGLDQEQPDNQFFSTLGDAVSSGQVPQSRLDDMVHRILRAMYAVGLFDYPNAITPIDSAADQAIAQEVEEQGAVLLRNANNQLPLNAAALHSIAVIGWNAATGTLSGGGSAQVYPTGSWTMEGYPTVPGWAPVIWDPDPPLSAIQAMAPNATVNFADGTNASAAATLAGSSDVAIVFVEQWTSEGMDMPSLNFTDVIHSSSPMDQDALVAAVAAANPHTIVVMENASAQVMPWLANVNAVLEAWFPGQMGATAIANILFGAVNPSGKLPITFPASVNDLPRPVIPGANANSVFPVDYTIEDFDVGYKWYDAKNLTPLFPFGFGLSYTTFSFANANVVDSLAAAGVFQVNVDVTNTGNVAGAEVAQVYVGLPASTNESPKRLVGWQKTLLQPGQKQTFSIQVNENDSSHPLSYWDITSNSWQIAAGDYPVWVGSSSAPSDLVLAGTLHIGS